MTKKQSIRAALLLYKQKNGKKEKTKKQPFFLCFSLEITFFVSIKYKKRIIFVIGIQGSDLNKSISVDQYFKNLRKK